MLYDGPVRVFHDRFVNFNSNKGWSTATPCNKPGEPSPGALYRELDDADCQFLKSYENVSHSPVDPNLGPPAPYEGDAALGWFQSNQNSYPTGTASRQLSFVNTNLRHQVYTALVSLNTNFNDGDKNTSIIDEDGTLDGFGVQLAPNSGTNPVHPISLNNLPFNNTSNSVDECLSRGTQNQQYEGRTSALMSPASMGTLQFSSLYPYPDGSDYPGTNPNGHWQQVTFTRDDLVPKAPPPSTAMFRPTMVMRTGRNGLGSFEPKVSNGYGYTVAVAPTTVVGSPQSGKAGLWNWIDVVVADVVDPNISKAHPFYIRLGIDYATKSNLPPPDASYFTIKRGYKSYVGGNVWQQDPELLKSWTPLDCNNLDAQNTGNVPTSSNSFNGTCPAASGTSPVMALSSATNIGALTNTDGTPNLDKYYYNPTTGYLYLNVAQNEPNPLVASPTGSCDSVYDGGSPDPACPDISIGETYYACPKNGCTDYTIAVKSDSHYTYVPGSSSTTKPLAANLKPAPAEQNKLVLYNTSTTVVPVPATDKQGVIYHTASSSTNPTCKATESPQP